MSSKMCLASCGSSWKASYNTYFSPVVFYVRTLLWAWSKVPGGLIMHLP